MVDSDNTKGSDLSHIFSYAIHYTKIGIIKAAGLIIKTPRNLNSAVLIKISVLIVTSKERSFFLLRVFTVLTLMG